MTIREQSEKSSFGGKRCLAAAFDLRVRVLFHVEGLPHHFLRVVDCRPIQQPHIFLVHSEHHLFPAFLLADLRHLLHEVFLKVEFSVELELVGETLAAFTSKNLKPEKCARFLLCQFFVDGLR